MPREPKVTLTLTEQEAVHVQRILYGQIPYTQDWTRSRKIIDAIKHALAECDCSGIPALPS